MKIKAELTTLAKAAKDVSRFLPRSTHLPITEHVLVEAEESTVAFTATDIESGRRVEVEANVGDPGRALVPAALVGILAGASGSDVELVADDTEMTVSDSTASWKLRLGAIDDYPQPSLEGKTATLTVENWSRVRSVAAFAQPRSGKDPRLQGVYFDRGDVAATDSYQMAYTNISADTDHPAVLVPANAILALDAEVRSLLIGERMVEATLDDGRWWTRLMDTKFPNVRRLVEDQPEPAIVVTFDADELTETVRRATLVGKAEWPVYMKVLEYGVEVTRREHGESVFSETIMGGVVARDTEEPSIALNPGYLKGIATPVERIQLEMTGPRKMVGFRGVGDDDWWAGAVMPVRVPGSDSE